GERAFDRLRRNGRLRIRRGTNNADGKFSSTSRAAGKRTLLNLTWTFSSTSASPSQAMQRQRADGQKRYRAGFGDGAAGVEQEGALAVTQAARPIVVGAISRDQAV